MYPMDPARGGSSCDALDVVGAKWRWEVDERGDLSVVAMVGMRVGEGWRQ